MDVSGQLHVPDSLSSGKKSTVPIGEEAGSVYSKFPNTVLISCLFMSDSSSPHSIKDVIVMVMTWPWWWG